MRFICATIPLVVPRNETHCRLIPGNMRTHPGNGVLVVQLSPFSLVGRLDRLAVRQGQAFLLPPHLQKDDGSKFNDNAALTSKRPAARARVPQPRAEPLHHAPLPPPSGRSTPSIRKRWEGHPMSSPLVRHQSADSLLPISATILQVLMSFVLSFLLPMPPSHFTFPCVAESRHGGSAQRGAGR